MVRSAEVGFRVLLSVQHYFISHHIKLKPFEYAFGSCFPSKQIVLRDYREVKLLQHYMLLRFNVCGCQMRTIKCRFLSGVHAARNDFQACIKSFLQ